MKINLLASLSVQQLKRAVQIKQQIEALDLELAQILDAKPSAPAPVRPRRKRTMSAAAKAKIAAAQKARWAKRRNAAAPKNPAPKKTRRLSPEGRANIVAATKARWAKIRAAKKSAKEA
jgi:hypothetical protein